MWKLDVSGVAPPKAYNIRVYAVNHDGLIALFEKLILDPDDGSKTIAAQYHRPNAFNRERVYLEISSLGMSILDGLILTIVFVEKKRRDRAMRLEYANFLQQTGNKYGCIDNFST